MKLHYWSRKPNFGDELNPFLWSRLIPDLLDDDDDALLVGIGTLLNERLPKAPRTLVFSTGAGYGPPPAVDDSWTFYCVRGPKTAEALGLDPAVAVTDGGVLVREFFERLPGTGPRVGFCPHWSHVTPALSDAVRRTEALLVDPGRSVPDVVREIAGLEVLVTESLHGAIVADALRVQWIPVRLDASILPFKWMDWCATVGVSYEPVEYRHALPYGRLGPLRSLALRHQLRRTIRRGRPVLSQAGRVESLCERLHERLDRLRRDARGA